MNGATPDEAGLARLYLGEARREQATGREDAAAFWWTQALVMALVAGEADITLDACHHLRAQHRLD